MALIKSNLYVFSESSNHNGKWLLSNSVLNADGTFEVQIQNEDKITYHLSSNYVIQAPMDTVWHRTPPLPFRRSVRETLSLHVKKGSTTWFLASSEEERDQWSKHLTSFTSRQPPPYGDYDNWNYSHLDSDLPRPSKPPFHPRRSITPTHRSGFYSVQEPRRSSSKFPHAPTLEHHSGLYSANEDRGSLRLPQNRSGFYSVQGQVKVEDKKEVEDGKVGCGWSCVACMVNVFSVCCQQCCLNFAAAI